MTAWRALGAAVAVALAGVGLYQLRESTISREVPMPADSEVTVVVESRSNRSEPSQTLREMTAAQLSFCRLEVDSDPTGPLEPVPGRDATFRQTFSPALDETDQKQFTGCIEDWVLDHHLVDVVSMSASGVADRRPSGAR